jgi:threonine/homoserine/homoserine lactone efflux protein
LHIDYAVLAGFTLLWLAIVPTPGPNSLLIVHLALTAPWREVAIALAGNLFGVAIYALGTLFGLALLLARQPSLRLAVYILGGAYLVWSGIRLARAGWVWRRSASATAGVLAHGSREAPARNPFLQGVLTALANVAALFFLASILAGAGILVASPATQLAALGVIVIGNGLYLSLLAWLLQRERPRAFYARNRGGMQLAFGVLFVVFGLRLLVRELLTWL